MVAAALQTGRAYTASSSWSARTDYRYQLGWVALEACSSASAAVLIVCPRAGWLMESRTGWLMATGEVHADVQGEMTIEPQSAVVQDAMETRDCAGQARPA